MLSAGFIGYLLIAIIFVISYRGFINYSFFEESAFKVERVLVFKEYRRFITSGFVHVGWMHLIFNLIALYSFSASLEGAIGPLKYLLIFLGSLIGGNLLSLFIHRYHGAYSAVGASGAISGIIFATIAINPSIGISLLFLPVSIPGWLFGPAFVLFSIYGIKSRRDNIGHDAHLGGALIGMILAIALYPFILWENTLTILFITVPSVIFLYIIINNPSFLLIDNLFFRQKSAKNIDDVYHEQKKERQGEIDRILEKIHVKGIGSLSRKEKELLDEYSKH